MNKETPGQYKVSMQWDSVSNQLYSSFFSSVKTQPLEMGSSVSELLHSFGDMACASWRMELLLLKSKTLFNISMGPLHTTTFQNYGTQLYAWMKEFLSSLLCIQKAKTKGSYLSSHLGTRSVRMTYSRANKAVSSGKQGNHPRQAQAPYTYAISIVFTSWTPNKNLLGRTALKRNISFPRSNLRNKNWNLKTSKKNSCSSTPYSTNEDRAAFSSHLPGSLAESTVGAVVSHPCAVNSSVPELGLVLATVSWSRLHSPLLPYHAYISSCSPEGATGTAPESLVRQARMTAWMLKRGSIWQDSIFLHTKQHCLYSIPPHYRFLDLPGTVYPRKKML